MPTKILSKILLSVALASLLSMIAAAQTRSACPFQNPALPLEQRVDDLVGRMTLEEKVSQMNNGAKDVTGNRFALAEK